MDNSLFVITLWDKADFNANEEPYSYCIVAEDIVKAEKIAIDQHKDECGDHRKIHMDTTLSFEVTCALAAEGKLYDVQLVHINASC